MEYQNNPQQSSGGTGLVIFLSIATLGIGGVLMYKAGAFDGLMNKKEEAPAVSKDAQGNLVDAQGNIIPEKTGFAWVAQQGLNLLKGAIIKKDGTQSPGVTPAQDQQLFYAPMAVDPKQKLGCTINNTRVLSNGSSGEDVKQLQACLNKNAVSLLVVDGKFGPLTAAELMRQTGSSVLPV